MELNKIFKNWEIETLKLNNLNDNYFETINNFYNSLINEHKKFTNKMTKTGELLKVNSPITLINGKEGLGKTFFIEKFIDNFEKLTKNDNYFTEYLFIDALDLIDDTKAEFLFLYELINKFEEMEFSKFNNSFKNNQKMIIDKLLKLDLPRTIVFIDSLDKIDNPDQLLKLLYKLRKLNNLIFVLIVNVDEINKYNKEGHKFEYPIDKFINLKKYDLYQDYKSIILNKNESKINFSDKELKIINNSLLTASDNQYSIRKFENWLEANNFFSIENEIDRLLKINEIEYVEIKNTFESEFGSEIDKYIDLLIECKDAFYELSNEMSKKSTKIFLYNNNFLNFNEINNKYIDKEGFLRLIKKNNTQDSYFSQNWNEIEFRNFSQTENWSEIQQDQLINTMSLEKVKSIAIRPKRIFIYFNDKLNFKNEEQKNEVKKAFENYSEYDFTIHYLFKYIDELEKDFKSFKNYENWLSTTIAKNNTNNVNHIDEINYLEQIFEEWNLNKILVLKNDFIEKINKIKNKINKSFVITKNPNDKCTLIDLDKNRDKFKKELIEFYLNN